MTGDEFGSRESLMQDYRWFARYNEAKFIRQKAEAEYSERKNEVKSWVKNRIEQNLDRICKDIIRSQFSEEKTEHPCRFFMTEMKGEWWRNVSTHDAITFAKDRLARFRRPGTERYPLHNNADAGCWFADDAPCSYILKAHAIYTSDLLYLTGCSSADELPDVLQHWMHSRYDHGYAGNHILERVDPMDWVVKNPWDELHFDVVIGIGKKYLSKAKKELGLHISS